MLDNEAAQALTRALNENTEMMRQYLAAHSPDGHITKEGQFTRRALSDHTEAMTTHGRTLATQASQMEEHGKALYAHAGAMNSHRQH